MPGSCVFWTCFRGGWGRMGEDGGGWGIIEMACTIEECLYKYLHWSPQSIRREMRVYWNCMYIWGKWGRGSVWGKNLAVSNKRTLFETEKWNVRRLFRTCWNLVYLFKGACGVLMTKNGEATEGKVSIVNCGETLLQCWEWWSCESPMGF